MNEPGRLLASGRDSDIFEFGPGLVLRRTRGGRSLANEARTMTHARDHGYPVPEVHELRGGDTELVMDRVDGPLMLDAIARRPWEVIKYARLLAGLHERLHAIPAPDWVPRLPDGGDRLVHLDLHPVNVIMSAYGPVVIDWANASAGEALSDVACTYVLVTCPDVPGPLWLRLLAKPLRRVLADAFARAWRGPEFAERLAIAAELKALDTNLHPNEVAACHRLAQRSRRRGR